MHDGHALVDQCNDEAVSIDTDRDYAVVLHLFQLSHSHDLLEELFLRDSCCSNVLVQVRCNLSCLDVEVTRARFGTTHTYRGNRSAQRVSSHVTQNYITHNRRLACQSEDTTYLKTWSMVGAAMASESERPRVWLPQRPSEHNPVLSV